MAEIPLEDSPRRHYIGVRQAAISQIQWDYVDPDEEVREGYPDRELWEVVEDRIKEGVLDSGEIESLLQKAFDLGYRMAGKLPVGNCPECHRPLDSGHKMDCSRQ